MTLLTANIHRTGSSRQPLKLFAGKLVDKIINASAANNIDRYIAVAVKTLDSNKVNGYIIQRFIDRVSACLDSYTALTEQQAANSALARKRLLQFREQISVPHS